MPNPTQPMNEEELRELARSIMQEGYYSYRDNNSYEDTLEECVKKMKGFILSDRNAAIREAEIALARKVLGVSSMVRKQKGVTQSMRLKHLTNEMRKIIPDTFGTIENETIELQSQPNAKEGE